jgi:hypothetical protein
MCDLMSELEVRLVHWPYETVVEDEDGVSTRAVLCGCETGAGVFGVGGHVPENFGPAVKGDL